MIVVKHVRRSAQILMRDAGSARRCSSLSSSFPITVSNPKFRSFNKPDDVGVLLFGFAGSSHRQLEKHTTLYNSLGYRTVSCILPHKYLFTFDIDNIKKHSDMVLEIVMKENMKKVVPVCFSNNGAILYQTMSQTVLSGQCRDVDIVGAVFDSAPGPPLGHMTFLQEKTTSSPSPPSKLSLVIAHLGVNQANGVSLTENLKMTVEQVRNMKSNPGHSWPTHFLRHQDQSTWPVLFIYSEGDRLLPWQRISSLVQASVSRGRRTEELRVQHAGHVAVMKMYPEMYKDKVRTFLKSLQ